jgi:hypothetical protein
VRERVHRHPERYAVRLPAPHKEAKDPRHPDGGRDRSFQRAPGGPRRQVRAGQGALALGPLGQAGRHLERLAARLAARPRRLADPAARRLGGGGRVPRR